MSSIEEIIGGIDYQRWKAIITEIGGLTDRVTATLYVSKNGNDSDGKTWQRAFTTVEGAIGAASSSVNDLTLIVISTGTYDINTSGVYTIDKNVLLTSASEFTAEIKNTHASATGIFKLTRIGSFSRLSLEASNNITALEYSGTNTYGSHLTHIVIGSLFSTGAHTLIKLSSGARGIHGTDVFLAGNISYTTGLEIDSSVNSIWNNLQVLYCIKAIHLHTSSLLHLFDDIFCFGCTTGIQIDATVSNVAVRKTEFSLVATNQINNGTEVDFQEEIGLDEIVGAGGYTDVLYLTPAGENIDGKSWTRAFDNWADCYAAIPATAGRNTLIIVGAGTYDIDTTGDPTYTKNFTIRGTNKRTTIFTNDHASATSVMKFTALVNLEQITIDMNDTHGLIWSGVGASGLYIQDCRIISSVATKAQTGILLDLGVTGYTIDNVILTGDQTHTTAIDIAIAGGGTVKNCIMAYCLLAGKQSNALGGSCIWRDLEFLSCITGISVVSGADDNLFRNILISDSTTGFDVASDRNLYAGNVFGNVTTEYTWGTPDGGIVERVVDVDTMAGIEGFTEVLYVSPDGDNSDGKSWNGAFNEIWRAIGAASSSVNHMTLILCAPAIYDINITGDPDIAKNVFLKGIGGTQGVGVTLTNDHAGATSVLKFTKVGGLFNLAVDLGTSNNGVIYSGATAIQGRLENVDIVMYKLTSQKIGVTYENCSFHSASKVYFIGNPTYAVGLKFDNLQYYIDFDNLFLDCLIGITSAHTDDDYMYFNHAHIHGCATGVDLTAACNDFILDTPTFTGNTTNFTAIATADYHIIAEKLDVEVFDLYPTTPSGGVTITGGAGADVYGAWTDVIPINTVTKPSKITGFTVFNMSDTSDVYFIQIGWGAGDTIIATVAMAGGDKNVAVPALKSGVIPENSEVTCRISTAGGGNDTLDIWIQYVEI